MVSTAIELLCCCYANSYIIVAKSTMDARKLATHIHEATLHIAAEIIKN